MGPRAAAPTLARRRHPPDPATWRRTAKALTRETFDPQALLELGWALGEQMTCILAVASLQAVEAQPVALQSALAIALGLHVARRAVGIAVRGPEVERTVRARASVFAASLVADAGAANACRRLAGAPVGAEVRASAAEAARAGEDAALAAFAEALHRRSGTLTSGL